MRYLAIIFLLAAVGCNPRKEVAVQKYTCPMHPEIIKDAPGTCPICFMNLVPLNASKKDVIMLTKNQIQLANIKTAVAAIQDMKTKTTISGRIVVSEEQTELISSRVPGRIERLYVKGVGQHVQLGQPLYEIYSELLLTLQQEYLIALRQSGELPGTRYETILSAAEKKLILFGMTRVQVATLSKERKPASRITFLSPASGVVARSDAKEGQYVTDGTTLYKIETLTTVWAEADLYPNETTRVPVGSTVGVSVEEIITEGKVIFVSPERKQGNQVITLRVAVDNRDGKLVPGMQASIEIFSRGKRALLLPVDAIIRDRSGSSIWIHRDDGAFYRRDVTTGEENEDEVEITDGLKTGENVVVNGAYLLHSEMVLKKG